MSIYDAKQALDKNLDDLLKRDPDPVMENICIALREIATALDDLTYEVNLLRPAEQPQP